MPKIDPAAVAVNAAGIAEAFGSVQSSSKADRDRFDALSEEYEGWLGVITQIAEAGEIMERFRVKHGATATWGGDLPYLYDVWDSIAEAMWTKLGKEPLEQLVDFAIERVVNVGAE
jgi:hypothetical protein